MATLPPLTAPPNQNRVSHQRIEQVGEQVLEQRLAAPLNGFQSGIAPFCRKVCARQRAGVDQVGVLRPRRHRVGEKLGLRLPREDQQAAEDHGDFEQVEQDWVVFAA